MRPVCIVRNLNLDINPRQGEDAEIINIRVVHVALQTETTDLLHLHTKRPSIDKDILHFSENLTIDLGFPWVMRSCSKVY